MSSFEDKVAELGIIAYYLINLLLPRDRQLATKLLTSENIADCWSQLSNSTTTPIRKFTLGFFFTPVPFQVKLADADFLQMFNCIYPLIFGFRRVDDLLRASASASNWCPILIKEAYYKMFGYKPMADSQHKLNMYFSEVILSARDNYPIAYTFLNKHRSLFFCSLKEGSVDNLREYFKPFSSGSTGYSLGKNVSKMSNIQLPKEKSSLDQVLKSSLYNDQASAIVMYYIALAGNTANPLLLLHAVVSVYCPDIAKALSIMVKNSGSNGTQLGSKLCEAQTLTGRGVGECSLIDEAKYRCDPVLVDKAVWHCDLDRLRYYIRIILSDELLDQVVEFEDLDSFWNRRWQWCVNGSHSSVLGKIDPRFKVNIPGISQVHRRCVVEQLEKEPISSWNGESYFTGSLKLEHGKLRALFACDTLTYFAFEHLLRPVEKKWHGHRVLLDPGRGGMLNIAKRIRLLQKRGACNVMIDFEDFNSQHSIEAQKILFEELIALTGYDRSLGDTIIKSFDHMNCYVDGKRIGHMYGTLCSGHRATTFINSVLNAAYIATVLGNYDGYESMHVGDDVFLTCRDLTSAAFVMQALSASSLRINPMKQSVGVHTAEFLRMAVGESAAYGYVARSISSAISGNWLTLHKQSPREFLQTMVEHAWTLANRSTDLKYPRLLVRSVARVTRLKRSNLVQLLIGSRALGNGPVRASDASCIVGYKIAEDIDKHGNFMSSSYYDTLSSLPHSASSDYLSKCVSELERETLQSLGIGVLNAMVSTSYSKTLSTLIDTDNYKALKLVPFTHPIHKAGKLNALLYAAAHRDVSNVGVLNRYPIITQIRNYLNDQHIRYLLAQIGGVDVHTRPLSEVAWGLEPHSIAVDGYLPYSDVVSYSAGVEYDYIRSDFPICM